MFFSKSAGGFFDKEIHGDAIPSDAVEISPEAHAALLSGQSLGKIITADDRGFPVLSDPPPATTEQITEAVSAARAVAYTSESDPIYFKAQRGEATMEEWLAKVAEIKARFPDGVMPKPKMI